MGGGVEAAAIPVQQTTAFATLSLSSEMSSLVAAGVVVVVGVFCLLFLALPTRVVARQAGGSFPKTYSTASRTFTGVWTIS